MKDDPPVLPGVRKKNGGATKRHTLTIAPPGCGKTYELTERLSQAVSSGEIPKDDILCITFTRHAAREMRRRIQGFIKLRPDELPCISTLHSFCTSALSEKGILGESVILDTDETMMDECSFAVNVPRQSSTKKSQVTDITLSTIQLYSLFQRAGLEIPDPILRRDRKRKERELKKMIKEWNGEIPGMNGDPEYDSYGSRFLPGKSREEFINEKIDLYEGFKKERSVPGRRCIDFNDILLLMKTSIEDGRYTHRFKRIFVDEVQDLNDFQMNLIHLLLAEDGVLEFFGDPQQSIYSFMGARAEMLADLKDECNVRSKLENRRSADYLVHFFNQYCQQRSLPLRGLSKLMGSWNQIPHRKRKEHVPEHGLSIVYARTVKAELRAIAAILDSIPTISRETTAILGRNESSIRTIIEEFTSLNKYLVIDPRHDYHSEFLRFLGAHLKVCRKPGDPASWGELFHHFVFGGSSGAADRVLKSMESVGLIPQDLAFRGEGSLLGDFHEAVTGTGCHNVLVYLDTEREEGPRVLVADLLTGQRAVCPPERDAVCRLPFWSRPNLSLFIDGNASAGSQADTEFASLMESATDSNGDARLFWMKDIRRAVRLAGAESGKKKPGKAAAADGPLAALEQNVTYLDNLISAPQGPEKPREDGGSPASSLLDRQVEYLSRMGIRIIRNTLFRRYRPIFEKTVVSFRMIDGHSPFYKILDWLLSVHSLLVGSNFLPEDRFGMMSGAKTELFSSLRKLEILRYEIYHRKLVARGLLEPENGRFWQEKDQALLSALEKMDLGRKDFREKAPEVFQSERDIHTERLNELQNLLSELRSPDFLPKMSLPIIPIIVMNVHQSKGQGFDNVFLFQSVNSLYKGNSATTQNEEDRIFYVGITRAKKRVIISYSDAPERGENQRVRPLKVLCKALPEKRTMNDSYSVIREILANIKPFNNISTINYNAMPAIHGKLEEQVPHISNRPQLIGTITIDGTSYNLVGWVNFNENGTITISLADNKKNAD